MNEETYELRLNQEGFQILPVSGEQHISGVISPVASHGHISGVIPPVASHRQISDVIPPVTSHGQISSVIPPVASHGQISSIIPPVVSHGQISGLIPPVVSRGQISGVIPPVDSHRQIGVQQISSVISQAAQHGQIAVQLIQPSDKLIKEEQTTDLFTDQTNLLLDGEEQLLIQYGDSWFHDLLSGLAGLGHYMMDFPVFCRDGICWSNRLLVATFADFLLESLVEDSCLILPDLTMSEVTTFHEQLFVSHPNIGIKDVGDVSRTGSLFGFQMFTPGSCSDTLSDEDLMDYSEIFRKQKEEYLAKVLGGTEVVDHVLSIADKPKRVRTEWTIPQNKKIECDECGRMFSEQSDLQSHVNTVHRRCDSSNIVRQHSCRLCDATFSYKMNVKRHMILVHPHYKEKDIGSIVRVDESENSVNVGDQRSFSPEDLSFIDSFNVRSEKDNPTFPQLDKFRCKICGDYQKSKRYLVAHIQSHYGGGYKCNFPGCTSVFKENAKLTRHKLVHTGVKAFKCNYCQLAFSLRHNLKMHEKTHTREDLQKCRFCDYETIQKSNMRLHEITHTRGSHIKPKGRPAGRYSGNKAPTSKTGVGEDDPDEIEKFIAEINKE